MRSAESLDPQRASELASVDKSNAKLVRWSVSPQRREPAGGGSRQKSSHSQLPSSLKKPRQTSLSSPLLRKQIWRSSSKSVMRSPLASKMLMSRTIDERSLILSAPSFLVTTTTPSTPSGTVIWATSSPSSFSTTTTVSSPFVGVTLSTSGSPPLLPEMGKTEGRFDSDRDAVLVEVEVGVGSAAGARMPSPPSIGERDFVLDLLRLNTGSGVGEGVLPGVVVLDADLVLEKEMVGVLLKDRLSVGEGVAEAVLLAVFVEVALLVAVPVGLEVPEGEFVEEDDCVLEAVLLGDAVGEVVALDDGVTLGVPVCVVVPDPVPVTELVLLAVGVTVLLNEGVAPADKDAVFEAVSVVEGAPVFVAVLVARGDLEADLVEAAETVVDGVLLLDIEPEGVLLGVRERDSVVDGEFGGVAVGVSDDVAVDVTDDVDVGVAEIVIVLDGEELGVLVIDGDGVALVVIEGVGVALFVIVVDGVSVEVTLDVGVGVLVDVADLVGVPVIVSEGIPVAVEEDVEVGVKVGLEVSVLLGVLLELAPTVTLGVGVRELLGVSLGVADEDGVTVGLLVRLVVDVGVGVLERDGGSTLSVTVATLEVSKPSVAVYVNVVNPRYPCES
mmetsp:Transcript_18191/g.70323  ORF Transcript_18191/g.70323 Transcript_18191/m.70323 type:complete len:613 (-) Transcript_18191:873-2711(-)